jgi:dolichyl-diphosphooligosaccharide--protein glycosyltransferase
LKPAFISWWDYGFYEVALGGHPTVADNFQDGIPPAANFHTSTSENEAVAVLITRLLQGHRINNGGVVSEDTKAALRKYLGENHTSDIISWIEGTEYPPSRGDPIGREYDPEISQDYPVGQQYGENAIYHDIVNVLVRNHDSHLTDDEITWLYHDLQETTGYSVRYYGVEGYDRQIFNIFAFLSDRSLLLVGGSEDDFIKIWYSGYEVDTSGNYIQGSETRWTAKDLMEMDDIEKRYIRVQNSDQELKDLYFESMFYKTYIGVYNVDLETGQRTVIERGDIQQPCVNMKHFYAEFISDMSKYQYFDTGKAAVVIAKYYEGAYLNGSVIFNGGKPPVDLEVAVRKNLSYTSDYTIPIKHDTHLINASDVNDTGEFNLIAGAGSHVSIRRNLELGANAIVVKEINFDGSEGTAFAPISDDDAMRKSDSNYKRLLNLTIEPANLSGYIYNDVNDDDVYNSTIDTTESGISVNIYEVLKFEEETVVLNEVPVIVTSNESGYFTATGLFPGIYRIILSNADNFALGLTDVALYSGNTTQDISIPKNSNLDGLVYFDEDQDEKYDNGEEIKGAKVELLYQGKQVGLTTTDEDGWYEFESIIPGKIGGTDLNSYNLKVSKLTEYQSDEFVSPEENKTTTYNVSIQLTPVEITGQITHEGEVVEGADINFDKDDTVKDNTADGGITTSNENGEYTINLKPGKYIVNISKYVEQQQTHQVTLMYEFTDGTLTLNRGEGTRSGVDFTVEKKSATVTGTTSYEGSYEEVTITFNPDDIDVNNTAVYAETVSDENGSYSVELTPGTYSISAESSTFEEDNVTYVYKFTSSIVVADTSDKTYDIQLAKEGLSIAPQ